MEQTIDLTPSEVAAIFAKWHKDFLENPDEGVSREEMLEMTPEEYGETASGYFFEIYEELHG